MRPLDQRAHLVKADLCGRRRAIQYNQFLGENMMNRMIKMMAMLALFAAAIILNGALKPTMAQATTVTSDATFPFTDTAVACNSELINLSGKMHVLAHVTTDAKSGRHVELQINTENVKGVGAISGNEYESSSTHNVNLNDSETVGGQSEYTETTKFLLVGKGNLSDLRAKTTLHITVNANGEVTAEVTNVEVTCR
jgi:hypothetical protein